MRRSRWTFIANGEGFIHSFNGAHSLFADTIRSLRSLAVAHQLGTVPLIIEAEKYEHAAQQAQPQGSAAAHQHDQVSWAPENGVERAAYTLAADLLTGIGPRGMYALAPPISGHGLVRTRTPIEPGNTT